ncbi:MAG: glycine reductase [Deltaproteobacteria bacterium]|nr:glycine reductase [Deltaproteobacteria bacterium]
MPNQGPNNTKPVVKAVTYFLAHVPNMTRHGSKPSRDLPLDPKLKDRFLNHLNPFEKAVAYAPNQVFIGNLDPDDLYEMPAPFYQHDVPDASRFGPFGEIMPEEEFIGMMKICDEFDIVLLETKFLAEVVSKLKNHSLIQEADLQKLENKGVSIDEVRKAIDEEEAMPLYLNRDQLVGCCRRAHEQDFNLIPDILIENLANRASGVMALRHMTSKFADPEVFDYLIGCGEEAVGDRYNRGGGNMAKAIGELSGCVKATGSDTKAFCCAPVHAIVIGAGLVSSHVFQNVCVLAGGSFAKLGMKFHGHLKNDMPILEDVIAGIAVWITQDDGQSPVIRLDSVGKHEIGSGSAQQAIFQKLVIEPLERLKLKLTDIDKFATEMHNPELTEPQGSGNVPKTNYRIIGSFAVLRKEIEKNQLDEFAKTRGMIGFSPTQGHIASAVPVLGHAVRNIREGKMNRAMFLAKGSLFLGRMTQLADGISFILEKNEGGK